MVVGAFLMLLNTFVDVGKGVLFFPILERHGKRTALVYLATIIIEVVFLDIGVLALLLLGPLAQQSVDAGAANVGWAQALGTLALQTNTAAYQIGELSLGVGAIFLCTLLFRSRLIPRFLAGWGVVGYVILAAGSIAEIFAIHISVVLSIPGDSSNWAWASGSSSRVSSPRRTVPSPPWNHRHDGGPRDGRLAHPLASRAAPRSFVAAPFHCAHDTLAVNGRRGALVPAMLNECQVPPNYA